MVRRNSDGTLSFVDRSKNIIRRSGENIAALEVEAVLSRHPGLKIAAVTPVPDEIRGEEVMACVILDDDLSANQATAMGLFKHAEAELAYYKTPGYVAFVSDMPLTATQKPKRNEIKQFAKKLIEEINDSAIETKDEQSVRPLVFDFRAQKKKST